MAKILIVEDEALVALEMEAILTEAGHTVIGIAPDMPIAIHLAAAAKPDVALVDLNLRDGLTGPQVGMRLGEQAIAVLFQTANPRLISCGVAGTIGVLTKPTDDKLLRAAVDFALARRAGAVVEPPARLSLFG